MLKKFFVVVLLSLSPAMAAAETIFPGYEWRDLGDGVFVHMRENPFAGPVDGNSTIIINEEDVFVVDTHINPAAARAVIAKIKSLTDKPVTHIINTHWHDDHTNGNQTFLDAFPEAKILAHPYTLEKLQSEWPRFIENRKNAYAPVIAKQITDAADALEAEDPDKAITYRVYAGYVEALKPELETLELAYPNVTIEDKQIFRRGRRKIVVEWVGRGNTGGDLVVWLPKEKILVTGDIVVAPIPYAFDSPLIEWSETLGRLARYKAAQIVPGHGAPQDNKGYLQAVIALLDETVAQVRNAADSGVAYEAVKDVVDLSALENAFTKGDPWAVNAWNSYYFIPGLESAWVALGYTVPEAP